MPDYTRPFAQWRDRASTAVPLAAWSLVYGVPDDTYTFESGAPETMAGFVDLGELYETGMYAGETFYAARPLVNGEPAITLAKMGDTIHFVEP